MNRVSSMVLPFSISLLFLQACSGNSEEVNSVDKNQQELIEQEKITKVTEVDKIDQKENLDTKDKTAPDETKNLKEFLTFDEFNTMFKQDPEETPYPNGKYQLKDGSIINADSFNYEASDVFDYATVIFYEGKLAHLQVDTELSVEVFEKRLGVSFNNANVVPYKYGSGYEVIFNVTFADENIAMFPNEWD